jgi:hypothetical protein
MDTVKVAGFVILLCVACTQPLAAQTSKGQGGLAGKVVVVSVKSSPTMGATLKQVRVERVGSREFLVGTQVEAGTNDDWRTGRVVWLALDDILQIVEFDSVEDLKQMREAPERDT